MATYSRNFGYQIATVLVVTAMMGWGSSVVAKEKHHDPSRSKRVVLDHDGAFEDFYAITAAALESQRRHPSIRLIAVTLSPVGEAYCPGSNGFPDQKEESIGDLTEKVLSIAGYAVPIYSGCGESRGTVTVNEIMEGTSSPTGKTLEFQVELPLGGQMALEPCRHHVEVPFFPAAELQCYYEFPKRFRNETRLFVFPTAGNTLLSNGLPQLNLQQEKKASDFLAEQMCVAKPSQPLTVVTTGAMTNLARAYQKIKMNPHRYGCRGLSQLKDSVETVHMGGAWDEFPANNFAIVPFPDVVGPEDYFLNELQPTWTVGNIYYDNVANFHVFSSPHVPLGATDVPSTFLNRDVFNALNNAEFNFFTDSFAVEEIINSGVPARFVALNATNNVPLRGFAGRLREALAANTCNNKAPAEFVRDLAG